MHAVSKNRKYSSFMKILVQIAIVCCVLLLSAVNASAQCVEYGTIFPSDMENDNGENVGRGKLYYVSVDHTFPVSMKVDSLRRVRSWSATLSGRYTSFDNEGGALAINPDDIINAGAMLTHVRTVAPRWNMIATAGVHLNVISDYIRMRSVALTAGAMFVYQVNKELNLGAGVVATTIYGEPVFMPLPFLTWKRDGKYCYELNLHGRPEFRISTQLNPKTRLEFAPLDMEMFNAVMRVNGETKVYVNNSFKATVGGSYQLADKLSIYAEVGVLYYHKVKVIDRSTKAFWRNLFGSSGAYKHKPSMALSVGVKRTI